jgi:hypothetical protein
MLPQLAKLRRQDRLRNVDHLAHEGFGLWTKSEIDASLRAEQIRHDGITAALHALEQQRRSALSDHASMDLGELEIWIDLGFDSGDFVFSVK